MTSLPIGTLICTPDHLYELACRVLGQHRAIYGPNGLFTINTGQDILW